MALCFCLRQLTYSYVHMYDSGTNYMSTVHNGKGCYTMYNVMIVMEKMGGDRRTVLLCHSSAPHVYHML